MPRQGNQGLLLASPAKSYTFCPLKLVTQEEMTSPLDFNPCYPNYWSAHSRDALFGAHLDSLSSQLIGFSMCHPIYNDHTMNLSLRHAIYSAIISTEATATFMFLPSWSGSMITNPYSTLVTAYPHLCHKLGTILANEIAYASPQSLINQVTPPSPGLLESSHHSSLEHSCMASPK